MKPKPTFDQYVNAHPGSTIIVIGNSASLKAMNLGLFDYFITIGVNRLLRLYRPTYLYTGDKSVTRAEIERMAAYVDTVRLIFAGGAVDAGARRELDGRYVYAGDMKGGADPARKRGPIDIGPVGNSGYQATQMAYRMGATTILLAGIDLFWPKCADSHFFGKGQNEKCRLRKPDEIRTAFAHLKDLYSQKGVSLASVSPWKTPLRRSLGYIPLEEAARDILRNAAGCTRTADL